MKKIKFRKRKYKIPLVIDNVEIGSREHTMYVSTKMDVFVIDDASPESLIQQQICESISLSWPDLPFRKPRKMRVFVFPDPKDLPYKTRIETIQKVVSEYKCREAGIEDIVDFGYQYLRHKDDGEKPTILATRSVSDWKPLPMANEKNLKDIAISFNYNELGKYDLAFTWNTGVGKEVFVLAVCK